MKTKLLSLQFAFFLKDIVSRPDTEFSDLNSEMLNLFDTIPQVIPIPAGLPPEIPVMMLRSSNGAYICNVSRSRIDFIVSRESSIDSNADILKDFDAKVIGMINYILKKKEIIRFGMVARFFYKDNTATRTIRNKYFNSSVDGSEELSLRYNKIGESFGYRINNIHEINAAEAVMDGVPEKGILVVRDINNHLLAGKNISSDKLKGLYKKYVAAFSEVEIERLVK